MEGQNPKRNNVYGIVAGIQLAILAIFVALLILGALSASNLSLYMFPLSVVIIVVWLYAYRISRRRIIDKQRGISPPADFLQHNMRCIPDAANRYGTNRWVWIGTYCG